MSSKEQRDTDARLAQRIRETGAVDPAVLDELLLVQKSYWKPFGRIAVELGFMKVTQVAKVLSHQATHPDLTFGAAARDLGFLRTAEIFTILAHQTAAVPSLAEVLTDEMVLEPGEVAELLHEVLHSSSRKAI